MPTKIRTLYVMREGATAPADGRPQVFIETTAKGDITYGVKVSAHTLGLARVQAQEEFAKLRAFVDSQVTKGENET